MRDDCSPSQPSGSYTTHDRKETELALSDEVSNLAARAKEMQARTAAS